MKLNHFDDADLKTLHSIMHRLYDDGLPLKPDDRRDLAHLMWLILDRVETFEIDQEQLMVPS